MIISNNTSNSEGGEITNLTDQNFDKEIENGMVLVDFWAEWCGPCKMIAPILEELAKEWEGKIKFAKLNVDDYPSIAGRMDYSIQGIPALILFENGKIKDRIVGAAPKPMYIDFLNKNWESSSQK